VRIRPLEPADREALVAFRCSLWPDGSSDEHRAELNRILKGEAPGPYPLLVLVAAGEEGNALGFAEVGLRSHADGCDPEHPVGYLEGWFVAPQHRGRGVGAALLRAAEQWARAQGCREMASDTWIDNEDSIAAHEALGYEIVDRCVNFRKALR
jgi:aminoglycoside 6'-N-acetyltransferase I